jgi:hypothetical protein
MKGINKKNENLVAKGTAELNFRLGQRIQALDLLAEAIDPGSTCPKATQRGPGGE